MATFFVVEDEPYLRKLYREVLELFGHTIAGEAIDGNDCIEKIDGMDELPDFILMDHRMPNKNGLDTLKELLEKDPNLKVILVSADITVKEGALSSGALMFIKKPFDLKSFIDSLDKLI